LDYEHHDMSETREPATADMQQAIPGLVGDIASALPEAMTAFHRVKRLV